MDVQILGGGGQESGLKLAKIISSLPEGRISAGSTRRQESGLEAGFHPAPCVSGSKLAIIVFSMPEVKFISNFSLKG